MELIVEIHFKERMSWLWRGKYRALFTIILSIYQVDPTLPYKRFTIPERTLREQDYFEYDKEQGPDFTQFNRLVRGHFSMMLAHKGAEIFNLIKHNGYLVQSKYTKFEGVSSEDDSEYVHDERLKLMFDQVLYAKMLRQSRATLDLFLEKYPSATQAYILLSYLMRAHFDREALDPGLRARLAEDPITSFEKSLDFQKGETVFQHFGGRTNVKITTQEIKEHLNLWDRRLSLTRIGLSAADGRTSRKRGVPQLRATSSSLDL